MKGLPFSAPMMLSWLAGIKTVTRRMINPQPNDVRCHAWDRENKKYIFNFYNNNPTFIRPRYLPGEIVYIKEKYMKPPIITDQMLRDGADTWPEYVYCADRQQDDIDEFKEWGWKVKPSMFMPEIASRSKALIVSVRPERLQEITKEDAIAEGLTKITKDNGRTWKYGIPDRDGLPGTDNIGWAWQDWKVNPIEAYSFLWNSINSPKYPFGFTFWSNPWVWRYELKKLEN